MVSRFFAADNARIILEQAEQVAKFRCHCAMYRCLASLLLGGGCSNQLSPQWAMMEAPFLGKD